MLGKNPAAVALGHLGGKKGEPTVYNIDPTRAILTVVAASIYYGLHSEMPL